MARTDKARGRPAAGTPALLSLQSAGIPFTIHAFDAGSLAEGYGMQAARELDLDPSSVFKTLLADVDGAATVAIVPVDGTLDLKLLAVACAARRAVMLDAAVAQRLTGYVVGGISPIGQKRPLPTVLDQSALSHPQVYVSGGRRGLDIGIAPVDLVAITRATVAPIARRQNESPRGDGPASQPPQ